MKLEARDISFSYSRKNILRNVSIRVEPLDFVGILGPNGCGKSTLVKNLIQALKPDSGVIELQNRNLKEYSIKELAKLLGFVPQKTQMTMPLLVKDFLLNACYPALERPFMGYTSKEYSKIAQIAKQVDIERFLDSNIFTLSGGEMQRVLLGRAMIKFPKILFLDEPTSALDLNYAVEMLSLCEKVMNTHGFGVVAILHDLNLASIFCKRVIMLKHGEIRYEGSVDELYTPEILSEIYNLRCDVVTHNGKKFVIPIK